MALISAQTALYEPSAPPAGWTGDYPGEGLFPTGDIYTEYDLSIPDVHYFFQSHPEIPLPATYEEARNIAGRYISPRPEFVGPRELFGPPESLIQRQGPLESLWDAGTGTAKFIVGTGAGAVEVAGEALGTGWDIAAGTVDALGRTFEAGTDFIWDAFTGTVEFIGNAAKFIWDHLTFTTEYTGQGPKPLYKKLGAGGQETDEQRRFADDAQPFYNNIEAPNLAELLRYREQPMPVEELPMPARTEPDLLIYVVLAIGAFMLLQKGR